MENTNKNNKGFTKNFISGRWFMVISNEEPMTSNGETYCKYDLTSNRNSFYGCPVNQFGTIEEVLSTLKAQRENSNKPEYECLREINKDKYTMYDEFISILENELSVNI